MVYIDVKDIINLATCCVRVFRLPTKVSFKGGREPNLCKHSYTNISFFLAFPNLGTRFPLRVVVCNIPDFWKIQKNHKNLKLFFSCKYKPPKSNKI